MLNCHQIYILHPNFKTQQAIEDVMNMMSGETRKQLVKIAYDWMDLSEVIEPNKIWIPFVSKKFTPMTYHVVKAQQQQQQQQVRAERYLKIANDSLLNIDAKTCTVQREILFAKMVDISTVTGSSEIIISYSPESDEERNTRGALYLSKPSSSSNKQNQQQQLKIKRYQCYTEQQRDIILEAIFEAAVRSASLNVRQTFVVQREQKKNKMQRWLIKLTTDSMLNFQDKSIKNEVPYSTIQSFYLDEKNKNKMLINYVLRGKRKCHVFVHERADEMRDALLDAIKRFKFSIQIEKDLLYKKDSDPVTEALFSNIKILPGNSPSAANNNTTVMPVETPRQELKKMFKMFTPTAGRAPATLPSFTAVLVGKYKLSLKEDQVRHLLSLLDKEERGFFLLDDLIKSWIYSRRERQMMDKKRELAKKKSALASSSAQQK